MSKLNKVVIILIGISLIVFISSFTMSLALNKKYVVDEIGYTKSSKGLLGIQKIIESDYLTMIYLNAFYIFLLIVITTVFFIMKKKR